MARLAFVLLVALLAVVCNAEETATILRRGDTAAVEEDASVGRRQLFSWGWILFHRTYQHLASLCRFVFRPPHIHFHSL
jgi:hypothetical protein